MLDPSKAVPDCGASFDADCIESEPEFDSPAFQIFLPDDIAPQTSSINTPPQGFTDEGSAKKFNVQNAPSIRIFRQRERVQLCKVDFVCSPYETGNNSVD